MLKAIVNSNTRSDDQTIQDGNLIFATAGKGIDFSAVSSGTGTPSSNLLDDYEEGSFTPTVSGSTSAGTGTYSIQVGRYTKIGDLVHVQAFLSWSAHTGTGNLRLTDLPFLALNQSNVVSAASISYVNNLALTANNIPSFYIGNNTNRLDGIQYPVGGGAISSIPLDMAASIIYSIVYKAQ
jgi:hypothetical protein